MSVEINKETFGKRVKLLYDSWKVRMQHLHAARGVLRCLASSSCCSVLQEKRSDVWDNANVLAVLVGGTSEDLRYLKSISLQLWLFGYELPGEPSVPVAACRHAGTVIQMAGHVLLLST